jgi:hypothetical protein
VVFIPGDSWSAIFFVTGWCRVGPWRPDPPSPEMEMANARSICHIIRKDVHAAIQA